MAFLRLNIEIQCEKNECRYAATLIGECVTNATLSFHYVVKNQTQRSTLEIKVTVREISYTNEESWQTSGPVRSHLAGVH